MATAVCKMLLLCLLFVVLGVQAYIPATPTNNTVAIQQGSNSSAVSNLLLQWYADGSLDEHVSYQLVGAFSTGVNEGALVHFSEEMKINDTSHTPWIALVACDANATNASMENDIFTLAQNAGAVAALLYSNYSQACVINPAYANPATFNQIMDIFTVESYNTASLIQYQFGQFGAKNESIYGSFDAAKLNQSASIVDETFTTHHPAAPGYLFATLTAFNATDPGGGGNASTNNASDPDGSSKGTSVAMITLYAITGCVSALFCGVIITGAIRAIRNPDRYGPRSRRHADGDSFIGQSRARGLTRAILDTFPIVKFGGAASSHDLSHESPKDIESRPQSYGPSDLAEWEVMDVPLRLIERGDGKDDNYKGTAVEGDTASVSGHRSPTQAHASGSRMSGASYVPSPPVGAAPVPRPTDLHVPGDHGKDVVPAAIGTETCPICIVDFEEGDDLRLLPCAGKHRFHQECVDPWLLELSSSCPICRQDFQALETMMSRESEDLSHSPQETDLPAFTSGGQGRFSRYLRFARGRQNQRGIDESQPSEHEQVEPDPMSSSVT